LTKPDPDDDYDVAVANGNMDILDTAPAKAAVCTSGSRPASPTNGDVIFETDGPTLRVRNGSAWSASLGAAFICTSGTRPSSTLAFPGMMIYETDTGNRQIRSASNTSWTPLSPYKVPDAAGLTALGASLTAGFLVVQTDIGAVWMASGSGTWLRVNGGSVTNRAATGFGTTGSTSYVSTLTSGTPASVAFTAPASGTVDIHNMAYMFSSSTAGQFCGFEVRTGGVIGSGTIIVGATDDLSLINTTTSGHSYSYTLMLGGLTAGSPYNVRQMFRVAGGTGSYNRHALVVSPA
jgi:hypothetical protein